MILVNLWDVTDKDIDKFTISLFENWGLIESTNNIEKVKILQIQ